MHDAAPLWIKRTDTPLQAEASLMQEQNVSFVAFPHQSPTPLTRKREKRVQKGSHLVLVLIAVAAKDIKDIELQLV